MRWAIVFLLLLPAVQAAEVVPAGDPDVGAPFDPLPARIAFMDADQDGVLDHGDPMEPLYLDMHADDLIGHGDLRLTSFLDLPAGSAVVAEDRDFALPLRATNAWFAATAQGDWYIDTNNDGTVGPNDVHVSGPREGARVQVGDPDVGRGLPAIQTTVAERNRIGWNDPDEDGRVDPGEPVFLDLAYDDPGSPQTIRAGDVRFRGEAYQAPPPPEPLTTSDVNALIAHALGQEAPPPGETLTAAAHDEPSGTDWGLVLGVVDLVAIVGLAAWVVLRGRAAAPPGAE